ERGSLLGGLGGRGEHLARGRPPRGGGGGRRQGRRGRRPRHGAARARGPRRGARRLALAPEPGRGGHAVARRVRRDAPVNSVVFPSCRARFIASARSARRTAASTWRSTATAS